jgi:hypothetical protein
MADLGLDTSVAAKGAKVAGTETGTETGAKTYDASKFTSQKDADWHALNGEGDGLAWHAAHGAKGGLSNPLADSIAKFKATQ